MSDQSFFCDLAIAGQTISDQLQQIADDYKFVLSLGWQHKKSSLINEKEKTDFWGLRYVKFPMKAKDINYQAALWVFKTIIELPKPTWIHCDNLIDLATIILDLTDQQGIVFEKVVQNL